MKKSLTAALVAALIAIATLGLAQDDQNGPPAQGGAVDSPNDQRQQPPQGGNVAPPLPTQSGPQGPAGPKGEPGETGPQGPAGEKGDTGEVRIVYAGGQRIELTQRGSRTVAARPVGHRKVYEHVKTWNPASVSFVEARDAKTLSDANNYTDRAAAAAKEGTSPMWLAALALLVGLVALGLHLGGRAGRPVRPYRS